MGVMVVCLAIAPWDNRVAAEEWQPVSESEGSALFTVAQSALIALEKSAARR
jgi:hypothetical protein